jgi:hypothetical protein
MSDLGHTHHEKKLAVDHIEQGDDSIIDYVPGTDEERALVRKMDRRLFPILWFMYIFNYIDRTNIGVSRRDWYYHGMIQG